MDSSDSKIKKFKKGAAMWAKRYRSKAGYAKEGYFYTLRLADGTFINLKRNPKKRVGDYQPDFVEFEPEEVET